jgi:lipoprotein-releasing system permease protein
MLSSFSLISLIGVMLGVLALVVVMAVFTGLERSTKERLLGSTPHILLRSLNSEYPDGRITGMMANEALTIARKLPHVQTATAFVFGNVLLDTPGEPPHLAFHGVDTTDPTQVEGIKSMLDLKKYPTSTAEFGIDDRAVISSSIADQFGIKVGDKLGLIPTANSKEILRIFKSTENPPVREANTEIWKKSTAVLTTSWKPDGEKFILPAQAYREAYTPLYDLPAEELRDIERQMIESILVAMDGSEKDEAADTFRFDAQSKLAIEKAVADLNATNVDEMDLTTYRGLKSLVLPKEVEVIGVYQASQMTVMPEIFVPIPLAQDLAGLDDAIKGISLRLDEPYEAEILAGQYRKILGEDWSLVTWGEKYQTFFLLIEQQRAMMYFVLIFIMLVSAFSIMAVMFTITIQKRREIGVMKALGASPGQIVRVFLYQGMILGTLGAGLGVGLGRLVILFRGEIQALLRQVGFDPFSSGFLGFNVLPAHNNPWEQAAFALAAFILCSVAALVPAFFAARSDAAKSLRNL